jgi:hypothetical protein
VGIILSVLGWVQGGEVSLGEGNFEIWVYSRPPRSSALAPIWAHLSGLFDPMRPLASVVIGEVLGEY